MTRFVRPVIALVLGGAVALGAGGLGCASSSTSRPSSPTLPLAQVDSLGVPAQIATTDTLAVHLSGTVGPNGCYTLARIETEHAPGQVTLRPLVQPPTDEDQMCTMALVPLDTTHRIAPPFRAGTLTLSVPQEEGPAVTATVEVAGDA